MGEIGHEVSGPSLLRMDNQSAIAVSKNPEHHGKMKHLSLCLFWLRVAVQDGLIAPTFVATGDMAADIFTKVLDRLKVQKCAKMRHGGVLLLLVLCQSNAPELLSLFSESCGPVSHSTSSGIVCGVLGCCGCVRATLLSSLCGCGSVIPLCLCLFLS